MSLSDLPRPGPDVNIARRFSKTLSRRRIMAEQAINKDTGLPESKVYASRVIAIVAERMSVTAEAIVSSRRDRKIVFPRHVAMWLCRMLTGLSYPLIGQKFGNRDHTSALYAFNKITEMRAAAPEIDRLLDDLRSAIIHDARGQDYRLSRMAMNARTKRQAHENKVFISFCAGLWAAGKTTREMARIAVVPESVIYSCLPDIKAAAGSKHS